MFPTHLLFGILVAGVYTIFNPSSQNLLILICVIGSTISDLDLFIGQHRKTLHFPVYSGFLFIITLPLIYIVPNFGLYINSCIFCLGMHSWFDAIGGGLGKRPWDSELNLPTVYNHYSDTWLYKNDFKYRIEYDGSPVDLVISLVLAAYIFTTTDTPYMDEILLFSVFISFVYTVSRKKLIKFEGVLAQYPIINWFITSLHGNKLDPDDKNP